MVVGRESSTSREFVLYDVHCFSPMGTYDKERLEVDVCFIYLFLLVKYKMGNGCVEFYHGLLIREL